MNSDDGCNNIVNVFNITELYTSVQFSCSVVSDSLQPHGLQHTRLLCPSLFQRVSSSYQVAKVLELQLQHPSNEYSGLIYFRIDLLDLLAVQGTLKSLLQHHTSEASVLQRSTFFMA